MKPGKVRFFCACGKEIWEGLPDWDKEHMSIKHAEETCECSDCILAEALRNREEEAKKLEKMNENGN